MSLLRSKLALLAVLATVALTIPEYASGQVTEERIACGASSGTQQSCKTSGYATSVRLVKEISGDKCRKGKNWGNTDSFIWTNGGCRGDFHVTYRTESAGGGSLAARCQADIRRRMTGEIGAASVQFISVRTLAVNPQVTNVQGEAEVQPQRGSNQRHTYLCTFHTQDGNRLARSEYNRKDQVGDGNKPATRVFSCGSTSGNVACNAFGSVASVRLVRADKPKACVQSVTWGYTRGAGDFWTKSPCKGDFEVTYTSAPQPR